MAVDSEITKQFLYRRAEASMLLEWSRTIEQHKQGYEVWISNRESSASASATAAPSNPPQHTKTRNRGANA